MANTKTTGAKASAAKNTVKTKPEEEIPVKESDSEKKYRVKQTVDMNTIIPVRNGFQGTLIYKSRRTQELFEWGAFGDEQDMTIQELRDAKNSSKSFFENNWFLIDDPEIIEYLGVSQYYKNALSYADFDNLFKNSPEEIKRIVSGLSDGQKRSVAYRAKQLIADGEIDSIKIINALEESLSVELIEK